VVETRQAVDGEDLLAGDVVRTGEDAATVAEIRHTSGAVTRLDVETEVTVDREWSKDRARVVVTLGPGRTWHRSGPIEDPTLFEVRCPGAVLTARFACFALFCGPDDTSVTVVDGNVVVRGLHGGSVALGDGQRAVVVDGVVVGVEDGADPAAEAWITLNRSLDADPAAFSPAPAAGENAGVGVAAEAEAAAGRVEVPRWLGRVGAGLAAAAFVGVLALTFVTADRGERPAAPSGAAAVMLNASTPTTVAEAPADPTAAAESAPPPAPAPAPVATATLHPTSCRRAGGSVVYSGTLTNTSTVPGSFAVDAVFLSTSGTSVASGSATTAVVEPQQTVRWEVRAPAAAAGAARSCETAGLRVLP